MKFSKIRMIKVCLKFIVAVNEGQNSLEFLRWKGGIIATEASFSRGESEIAVVIIYTKKLLNSDWLRKECSSSVTRVQNV